MSLFVALASNNAEGCWNCLPKCVIILERMSRSQYIPQEYTYYGIPSPWLQAIFSDDSDDDMDGPLNNQPVVPVKTSEGANMALNRLVAEDFLESLGKELGLDVPPEKPAPPQNVLFGSQTLSTADTSVSSTIGKITTCSEIKENENSLDMVEIAHANADGPSANDEKLDLKYEKQEHRAEKGWSHSSHHHTRNGSPESDYSSEQRRSKKRKSHSRRRTCRSRTPDADSSRDTQQNKRKRQEKRHHRTRTLILILVIMNTRKDINQVAEDHLIKTEVESILDTAGTEEKILQNICE